MDKEICCRVLAFLNYENWLKCLCKVVVFASGAIASKAQNKQSRKEDGHKIGGARTSLNPQSQAESSSYLLF